VLRWLRRPWGIVTVADIDRAFRGLAPDDKQDEVPRAFSVLTPMLQTEVEDHLASKFGVSTPQRARGLVSRLISCRHSLYLLRRLTRRIHHKRAEQSGRWFRAHTLIDFPLRWVYQCDGSSLERISSDITELKRMLSSGQWLHELLAAESDPVAPMTPEQDLIVRDYLDDPDRFTSGLFRFQEPKFRLEEWISIFPPQSFSFQVRAIQTNSAP